MKSLTKKATQKTMISKWELKCTWKIKKTFRRYKAIKRLKRKDQVVISRLRIGHNRYTHSHRLSRVEEDFFCQCGCLKSVAHLLDECSITFGIRRDMRITSDCLSDDTAKNLKVIDFLKEVQIYDDI